ncbi:helix-turn-helix transcriptional regulator [Peribacillus castrilensis]|uniref:AraC family transcriptional regulator n=1 Tax=Peribacillus simplex TaxID=1478 RepID=A0AAN2PLE4_9BACI|nr:MULTISPECIES: AraC family transcriptional regulator [Bacillaceae]MCP1095237.1 AraC family transcriptional regulator [Bacillaceae bacterium OS4b]MBD8587655.1 helix-turn-helix transcriptional regulator [Peribacillus simplex]MCF7624085.1 AraC family transcriptional regulator [Peribacillus frigoritolerans]MCP1154641.1 AraC family transcriptional regulator [Peribacillus frigoritolerans]MCT1389944.1 AraC family transcriptional regulator [Peribacillus frigoritolerans]
MRYSPIIQKTIEYIENSLQAELSLENISRFAGFSKFHYHRIFHKEVGVTVSEYIRYRRIANAANMLLYTDEKIIDIALYYRFETQESFTRSFKKYYDLPPGQYRKLVSKLTLQKEEMTMKNEQLLKGWNVSGSHPFNYQMGIDRETFHKGQASGFLKSVTTESKEEFATMMQQFKAENYLGKRMKLSGFLKSKGVDGFCGLWMRVDNALQDVLQFDNMGDRPIVNDTEWNHYYIVLDVPENSAIISFGVLLSGRGQVWIDELEFEEVSIDTPTTNIDYGCDLLDGPANLSFEE